ncbi:MAG: hypothetical protein HUJ77_15305, partial [Clostridium sp.]|uniref:hypothetical protein n=1 Tax=Clostridium sp. TaxID=1506 RepID=UPI0025C5A247
FTKYLTYLLRHGQDAFTAKDYSSRTNTILEKLDDNFINDKGYNDIPGSRNFLSFDGRYIINKKNIDYIKQDIIDYYTLKKRLNSFKDINVDEIVTEIEMFLEFMLSNKLLKVNETNIEKYCYTLDRGRKNSFINAVKSYSDLKGLDLDKNLLDNINEKNKDEIKILEKAKSIREYLEKYPSMKEEVLKIINEEF